MPAFLSRLVEAHGLATAGLACAAGSAIFAASMLSGERAPSFGGAEHLALFARPRAPAAPSPAPEPAGPQGVDMTPTASIAPASRKAPGHVLRGVYQGRALVQGADGFRLVAPGDEIAGLGRVIALDSRDGRWVVVTAGGIVADDRD